MRFFQSFDEQRRAQLLETEFPRGVPGLHGLLYPLDQSVDWLMGQLATLPQPFLSYIHFMPPHSPYRPSKHYIGIFEDDWQPVAKPEHRFAEGYSQAGLSRKRLKYDEYIAYVDAEFGRLLDFLDAQGFLENTWLILTSDHGEMFERGIWKHITPVLYEPLLHVPLLIHAPGQSERQDVHVNTSNVDLLPTVLHLAGKPIPNWVEGEILPPFAGGAGDAQRSIFALEAKQNPKYSSLRKFTAALFKGDYKLIHSRGYKRYDGVTELYDLSRDPQELLDLSTQMPSTRDDLERELLDHLEAADRPYGTDSSD